MRGLASQETAVKMRRVMNRLLGTTSLLTGSSTFAADDADS